MKRTLALVLAVLMVVTSLSFCVVAEDTATTYDGTEVIAVDTAYYFNDYEPTVIGDGSEVQELLPVEQLTFDQSTTFGVTFVYKVTGAEKTVIADDFMLYTTSETQKVNDKWGGTDQTSDKMSSANLTLNDGYYWIYLNDWILTNGKLSAISGFKIFHEHFGNKYSKDTARDPLNENENATFQMLAVYANNMQPTVTFYDRDGAEIGSKQHQYTNITKMQSNTSTNNQKGALLTPDAIFELGGFTAPTLNDGEVLLGWATTQDAGPEDVVKGVYADMSLYPVIITPAEEDYQEITFVDVDGKERWTGKTLYGKLMTSNHPTSLDSYSDGVYTYVFAGWSIDGENVVDPVTYNYVSEVTFKPVYTKYGVVYENPTATDITYNGSAINLLPEVVPLVPGYTGITLVYKVEGADSEIIADDFRITTNTGNPAWQWADNGYSADGMCAANLELNNGYYYLYLNSNLFHQGKTSLNTVTIYNSHLDHFYSTTYQRDPKNENESATFTMLAVVQNNLQPNVTFHDADGNAIGTYPVKYTTIDTKLSTNWQPDYVQSVQEGKLVSGDEAFVLSGFIAPEKASTDTTTVYVFTGWGDKYGNKIEAIYTNVDLYPIYDEVKIEEYTVTFRDADGADYATVTAITGKGLQADYPTTMDSYSEGGYTYVFKGWSVDGNTIVDPATYDYRSDITFQPVYVKTHNVTFLDLDGKTHATAIAIPGEGLLDEYPTTMDAYSDGVYTYVFAGWSVDGETTVDPATYDYRSDITFKPVYTKYGQVFTDNEPIKIGTGYNEDNTRAPQDMLPVDSVALDANNHGVTFVYKVDGAISEIIADDFFVNVNKETGDPAHAWGDLGNGSADGCAANLTLSNGYYYLYLGKWILANNNPFTSVNSFTLFHDHVANKYNTTTARDPFNDNENATFRMLAVIQDNLQPTIVFHDADDNVITMTDDEGNVIDSYQHKYTDVEFKERVSGGTHNFQNGKLISGDKAFELSGFTAPTVPEGYLLLGWAEKPNATEADIVDAIYTNMDLYPVFVEVTDEDKKAVLFHDRNGTVVYEGVSAFGELLTLDYPTTQDAYNDGYIYYEFKGWSVDGLTIVNPSDYEYTDVTIFEPVFTEYGKIFEDPTSVKIPQIVDGVFADGSAITELNLLPEAVALQSTANGITIVYKVEGADSTIIADHLVVGTNGKNSQPSWQWCALGYSNDGLAPYAFNITNGYHYMYINKNLTGTISSMERFSIFATHLTSTYHGNHTADQGYNDATRANVNDNENATFTILAVLQDNLQPNVTFYDAYNNVYNTYKHPYTNITSNLGTTWAPNYINSYKEGDLLDGDAIFKASGLTAPVKASTDTIVYVFTGWGDKQGNKIENIWQDVELYPIYDEVTIEEYTVTFRDADGADYKTVTAITGKGLQGEYPTTMDQYTADGYTYVFTGWSVDGNTIVDPATYDYRSDITFQPVYVKAHNVTFLDLDGKTHATDIAIPGEGLLGEYPTTPAPYSDGVYTHAFTAWSVDGQNPVDLETYDFTADVTFKPIYGKYGIVFTDNEPIKIGTGYNGDGTRAPQDLLPVDQVTLGKEFSTGVTFVYLVEGADTPITADDFIVFTNTNTSRPTYQWKSIEDTADGTSSANLTLTNGYHFLYLNDWLVSNGSLNAISSFTIFNDNSMMLVNGVSYWVNENTKLEPSNANENATFRMLAVIPNNLQPTVTFVNEGVEIGSYRYEYTNINTKRGSKNSTNNTKGELLSAEDIFNESKFAAPTKAADDKYVYVFKGWADAPDGEIVDAVYENQTVYAVYDAVAKTKQHTVTFVSDGKDYTVQQVWGQDTASAPADPTKAPDNTGYYTFEGWSLTEDGVIVDLGTIRITDDTTFYAVYTKVTHVHDLVATGAGTAKCVDETCGKVLEDAFTVIADPGAKVNAVKAGETVTVPIIVTNGAFVGANLKIVTSDNVTVTDIDVKGTLFEGYIAKFASNIVLDAAMGDANITADGTIVYLTLTANADIAVGDTVTVQVVVNQIVNFEDEDITAKVADRYVATYTAVEAEEDPLWGDVNDDGQITAMDAGYIYNYVNGWSTNSYSGATNLLVAGDVNGDGEISAMDAGYIYNYVNGWSEDSYSQAGNLLKSIKKLESVQ